MDYAKRAIKGTLVVLAMFFLSGSIGYALRVVLARNLAPADYGLFYAVFSFIFFFSILSDFGLNMSVMKFIPEFQVKNKPELIKSSILFIFGWQLISSIILSSILFLLSNWLSINYFHEPRAYGLINIFVLIFFFSCLSVFTASLQGFQRFFWNSSINLIKVSATLVVSLIYIYFNGNLPVYVPAYGYLVAYILMFIVSVLMMFRSFPRFFRYKTEISRDLVKKLFMFGLPITLSSLSYQVIGYMDTIILTYFRTLNEVALYNIAMPLSLTLMWFFAHPLSSALFPLSSEMWAKKNLSSLRHGMEKIQQYTILGIVPLALIFISFPEVIINVLFGESYLGASFALQVLSFGVIFYSLGFINSNVLSGIGKPQETTKVLLYVAAINFILNFALIPFFGVTGAAIATSASYIFMMILTSLKLRKYIKFRFPVKYFAKTLVIGIVLVALIYYLKGLIALNPLLESVLIMSIAACFYLAAVKALNLIGLEEIKNLVRSVIK